MTTAAQTSQTLALYDAVQAAVPFGLTTGECDRMIELVRAGAPRDAGGRDPEIHACTEIAKVIMPAYYARLTAYVDDPQCREAYATAKAVHAAVRAHDATHSAPDVVWIRATAECNGSDTTTWSAYHREEWDALTPQQKREELNEAGDRALEALGASYGASLAEGPLLAELDDETRAEELAALAPLRDPRSGDLIEFTSDRGRRQRLYVGHVERHRDAWLMWLGTSNQATRLTRDQFRIVGHEG